MPCSSKATGAVRCAPSDTKTEFRRGLIVLGPDAVPAVEAITVVVCAKTWACRPTGELPIQMNMEEIASTTVVTALFKTDPPRKFRFRFAQAVGVPFKLEPKSRLCALHHRHLWTTLSSLSQIRQFRSLSPALRSSKPHVCRIGQSHTSGCTAGFSGLWFGLYGWPTACR